MTLTIDVCSVDLEAISPSSDQAGDEVLSQLWVEAAIVSDLEFTLQPIIDLQNVTSDRQI